MECESESFGQSNREWQWQWQWPPQQQRCRRRHFDTVRSVGSTHDWHAAVEPVLLYWPAGHAQGQNRVKEEEEAPHVPSSPE